MGGVEFLNEINTTNEDTVKALDALLRETLSYTHIGTITIGEPLPELKHGNILHVHSYDKNYWIEIRSYREKNMIFMYGGKDDSEEEAFANQVNEQYLLNAEISRFSTWETTETPDESKINEMKADIDWLTSGWTVSKIGPSNMERMREIRKKYGLGI